MTSGMTRVQGADAVDSAIFAVVRSSDLAGTMEPIWRYAVRDQWYIGHRAIFAAQNWPKSSIGSGAVTSACIVVLIYLHM
jgi:hypothetical protein